MKNDEAQTVMDVIESTEVIPQSNEAFAVPFWRRSLKAAAAHAFVIPVFLVIALVISWIVTQGTWKFFEIESFGTYYDALAKSMRHGRFDIPEEAISGEAFIRKGKFYGYFGMTPALFRIVLNQWWPSKAERWSRTSLLVASLVSVLYTYRIVLALLRAGVRGAKSGEMGAESAEVAAEDAIPAPVSRDAERSVFPQSRLSASLRVAANRSEANPGKIDRAIIAVFLLCAGIGSTHVFLASRPFIYHEAIAWGSTLALASAYYVLRYLIDGRLHLLIEAGAMAFLAFFARPTAGAGAVFMCGLLALLLFGQWMSNRRPQTAWRWVDRVWQRLGAMPRRHALRDSLTIGSLVLATGVCYLATNYAKFRTFDGVPVKYYTQYLQEPARMKNTGGKQIHLGNFETCFVAYFWRPGVEFHRQFPWMFMPHEAKVYPHAAIDDIEWASTIPWSMPWAFLLWVIGVAAALRGGSRAFQSLRLPLIGLAVGGSVILFTVGITERYLHDIYPFFAFGAAAGLCWLLRHHLVVKSAGLLILVAIGLFAIAANNAFALQYQREAVWGVPPDRVAEFHRWRADIDALIINEPLKAIETSDDMTSPVAPVPGQLWKVDQTHTTYWYDGSKWMAISGAGTSNLFHLKVRFGSPATGVMEPLITRGVTGAGDFVYVIYLNDHQIQFGYDHWGIGGPKAAPVPIAPDSDHDVSIDFDHINRCVTIWLDGATILRQDSDLYPARPDQVWIGTNPIGGLPTQPFSGTIQRLDADSGGAK